jgi:hypothetical protein
MIQRDRQPRALRAGGLRALHLGLNSPVVAHESLPSGPAAAAVAQDADGALVCLRSLRSGHTAFFASIESLAAEPRTALDAALAFAERLGFVFDVDAVAARGESAALRLWHELCGDAPAPEPEPELELDDDFDADLEGEEEALWLDAAVALATSPEPGPLPLSKFRFFDALRQEEPR